MMEINKRNVRSWSMLGARGTFGKAIFELASENGDFMVLSADLSGSSGLKRFVEVYGDRFINVGIAEQNMISIAAGMAKEGITVFATSFAPFITMRGCEQVRMDVGYMNTDVKLVGIGSGLSMAHLGNSHYGLEDVAMMRTIPNMTIISPADGVEIVKTVYAAAKHKGPIYIRLTGAANNSIVYKDDYEFEIGKAITLQDGDDIAFIASGTMVYESLQAAKILEEKGVSAAVINMHTIKPLDTDILDKAAKKVKMIVTVEEHTVIGGLGSAVAEYKSKSNIEIPHMIIGLEDKFGKSGDYRYLLEKYNLTGEKIAKQVLKNLKIRSYIKLN